MDIEIKKDFIESGISIPTLLSQTNCVESKGQGRRIIIQYDIYINGIKNNSINRIITDSDFIDNKLNIKICSNEYIFYKE